MGPLSLLCALILILHLVDKVMISYVIYLCQRDSSDRALGFYCLLLEKIYYIAHQDFFFFFQYAMLSSKFAVYMT